MYDIKVENGYIVDGPGSPGRVGDVGISQGQVTAVFDADGPARRSTNATAALCVDAVPARFGRLFGGWYEGDTERCGGSFFPAMVSLCRVDAGGVAAEWVEATVATPGQATFVQFSSGRSGVDALVASRELARDLAIATGARVFSVGCRRGPGHSDQAAVEDGIAAYAWLLGEGLDLQSSSVTDSTGDGLARAVLVAARACGLPIPPAIRQVL